MKCPSCGHVWSTKEKKYTDIDEIGLAEMSEIAAKYRVSVTLVSGLLDEMTNWCEAKGKSYKNYKAALMNWVRRRIEKDPSLKRGVSFEKLVKDSKEPEKETESLDPIEAKRRIWELKKKHGLI